MADCQVLFSVLVLHWVTSKDSNGGPTADKTNSRSANNQSSKIVGSKGGLDKPGYGHNGVVPSVTTHISAVREVRGDSEDDDEISKAELGMNNKEGAGFPMGRITVQVGQVRQVEGGRGRNSVVSTTHGAGTELSRGGSYRSSEELVERTEIQL